MSLISEIKEATVTDARGRVIAVKQLSFKERHRLFKAVGRSAAGNEAFLADCMVFASVRSVDGVPVPPVSDKTDVEPIIDILGDEGCSAVQTWFAESTQQATENEVVTEAKN